MNQVHFTRNIPVIAHTDVLVVGAGPAGICAAIAAAQENVDVLVVDQMGFCGGMATAGLVGPILGVYHWDSGARILGGIPYRLLSDLEEAGGAELQNEGMLVPFDPEVMKQVCDEALEAAGVSVRYHVKAITVMKEGNRLTHVVVGTGRGLGAIKANMFIDCTGDGLIAAEAGARFTIGRPSDQSMMPMTTVFRLGGVGENRLKDSENVGTGYVATEVRKILVAAMEQGKIPPFGGPWIMRGSTLRKGEAFVNMVRQWGDPTDWESLSKAEIAGRRDMFTLHAFLREHVPTLGNSFIMDSGSTIGVRDSRHFVCANRLSFEDCMQGKRQPDSIAVGGHIQDIHATDGSHSQIRTVLPAYEIPYGSVMLPDFPNVLIGGRILDADYEIFASARVMGTCMAIGQGVGTAAALCVREGVPTKSISIAELATRLESDAVLRTLDSLIYRKRED
jgi:hypothetical protein